MKFDVIIGNPPYQLSDGGHAASAKPLYHLFVQQALLLVPRYLCMIIPARWYAGGKGLDEFRELMLTNQHIRYLIDYSNSGDCFPGVNVAGGICYFLIDKQYNGKCLVSNIEGENVLSSEQRDLNEFAVFVRSNESVKIIHKVLSQKQKMMDKIVRSRNSFNLPSNERGHTIRKNNDLVLLSSNGLSYIMPSAISDNDSILSRYKVVITYAMSGGNKPDSNNQYQILSSLQILKPNEVCTETFLVIDAFLNIADAQNLVTYMKTKLSRFLMLQALSSIHITKNSFQFVPLQDFSHPWTDEMLYEKYGLTDEEIAFIESMIRPME